MMIPVFFYWCDKISPSMPFVPDGRDKFSLETDFQVLPYSILNAALQHLQ